MPRTYVNNASNRSAGRVGMPVGSAVISRSSGGGSGGGGSGGSSSSYSSSSSSYVDNSMNRSLGRVGLPLGSAVHSSSGSSSYQSSPSHSSSNTYVDNSMNRSLGRVGLELGSAVHSTSSGASPSHSSLNTYVDNSMNRSLGRVGLELGSAVHSTSSGSSCKESMSYSRGAGIYVDNPYNRRLGRVGLALGSVPQSSSGSAGNFESGSGIASAGKRTYVDNAANRKMGRVGKVVGTAPVSSRHPVSQSMKTDRDDVYRPLVRLDAEDDNLAEILRGIIAFQDAKIGDLENTVKAETAKGIVHRHEAALAQHHSKLKRPEWLSGGELVDFSDLEIGEKLGGGGFGDVFVAIWKTKYQVAVKKLRVQRVSQKKKEEFQKEVKLFSSLSHPAIVKFYGASVISPNLAIVMEFMSAGSLHDVLHVEERKLELKQKFRMINDLMSALAYLHGREITHRDIKCMNIMVCEDLNHCKLGDFGLGLKEESRSSSSVADFMAVGTLRYSPPEVLDGERLSFEKLIKVDIYSVTIVIVELLTEKEPFIGLNQHQIRRDVLQGGRPSMEGDDVSRGLKVILKKGMSQSPSERPTAAQLLIEFKLLKNTISGLTQPSSSNSRDACEDLDDHVNSLRSLSISGTP